MGADPPARAFFRDPVAFAAAHPDPLVKLSALTGRAALVQDPEEAWRILVTDADRFGQGKWKRRARRFLGPTLNTLDGPAHRERRLLLQPALDRRRVADATGQVVERARRAQSMWREGDRIRIREMLDPLSLTMAGDVLLGVDLEPRAVEIARSLSTVMSHVPRLAPPFPGTAAARALSRVRSLAAALLTTTAPNDPGSLVGILRDSGLPEETCVGEVMAFLLAAADEPPSGIAAAWYLLARDERVDQLLAAELEAGNVGEERAWAGGPHPYLEAVIQESLRLFPPARHVDRCPVATTDICGTRIGGRTNVVISPLVLHRSESAFEDPDAFVPERWLDTRSGSVSRGAYVPFGAGPHTCIGEALARLIMTATLATIGRRWRLRLETPDSTPEPGQADLEFTVERR